MSASDAAELSSLSTALEELGRRVTAMAERLAATEREDFTTALFEIERALREAHRRLSKLITELTD